MDARAEACEACLAYQAYIHILEQEIQASRAELADPARYDRSYYDRHTELHEFATDLMRALHKKGCEAYFMNQWGNSYPPSEVCGDGIHNEWLRLDVYVSSSSGYRSRSIACSDLIPYGAPFWHAAMELFRTFVGEDPPAWFTKRYVLA